MRRTLWTMKFQMLLVAIITGILAQSRCIAAAESPRERISIDDDWRFIRNDPAAESDIAAALGVVRRDSAGSVNSVDDVKEECNFDEEQEP